MATENRVNDDAGLPVPFFSTDYGLLFAVYIIAPKLTQMSFE
jgi:hypothetical protein